MKKLSLFAMGLFAALFLGAGCERNSDVTETPSGPRHVIAVIPKLTKPVFWQAVLAGAQDAGKEYGYEIIWDGPDRETNSARQIQIINDAIARHVEGVVLAPVDRTALVPSVEKLAALNIPCAIIDSGLDTIQFLCIASTDNYQGGVLAARRMGQILGGKGNVIVVSHLLASHAAVKRVSGFTDTIAKEFPGIKIVDTQSGQDTVETARKATTEMLKRNRDVQGLFACNVDTSVGALQALQEQKRNEIKMVAFDPDKVLLDGMRAGQVDSIVLQNPYRMGYEGVKALAMKLKGLGSPRIIDTGLELATSESITDPKIMRLLGAQQ